MENVEVNMGDLKFEVTVDGDIFQPQRVSGIMLDEVRLQAADTFLAYKRADFVQGTGLTKAQREYWSYVRAVTPPEKRGKF